MFHFISVLSLWQKKLYNISAYYRFWRPYPEDNFYTQMRYFRGFIQLQDMLERAIVDLHVGKSVNTTTYLQQFPTPCHVNDQ